MNEPNCVLEAKGWTGEQTSGEIYFNHYVMELAGDKLEAMVDMNCADCPLKADCNPRPLFDNDEFVGVRTDL